MSELFPETHSTHVGMLVQRWTEDYRGFEGYITDSALAFPCARCGALVLDRDLHTRWHGSVDSNATAALGGTDA